MAPKQAPKRSSPEVEPPSASSSSSSEEDDQLTDNEQEQNHDQEAPKETAQSGSSDEEEDEEEDEDEEEEEEKVQNEKPSVQKPTPTTPTTTTKNPRPNSPSDSGSDSESDSAQPSPTASAFTVRPTTSKPMESPKKPASKPSSAKRPATTEANGEKNANKKKAKVEEVEEKKSGGSHNRLWSEDDEIVILKGMADFEKEKGADPSAYMAAFHATIQGSLSVEVSRGQLMDKVRRLKKKYAGKGENGEDPVFSKPHEIKCFELSKEVWGGGRKGSSNGVVAENGNNGKSGNKRARKTVKSEDSLALLPKENGNVVVGLKGEMKDVKVDDFWPAYPYLKQSIDTEVASGFSMNESVKSLMVENMSLIGKAKANELEKKWKSLRAEEAAVYLKRVDLFGEQTKLVLDAMKDVKD